MRGRASPRPTLLLLATVLLLPAAPASAGDERVILVLDHPLTSSERATLTLAGYTVLEETTVTPTALVLAPRARAFGGTGDPPFVAARQPVEPLEFHLDRSRALSRADPASLDLPFTGRGVTVAVVDSGLDVTHPDLSGRVAANVKYVNGRFVDSVADTTGHGTHVASIVAGSGAAGGPALAGVAPGARLVGVDISGEFDTAAALEAMDWIFLNRERFDIRVVVAAWGRQARGERFDPSDALVRATDRLVRDGVVVVFSASNHGPTTSTLSLEAQNPNVITVGATDDAGVLARYSSRGPALARDGSAASWTKPDVVAAGTAVLAARARTAAGPVSPGALPLGTSQLPGVGAETASYQELTGTSQSAPHVAGVVALMLEANPRLTPAGVLNALRSTAIDLGPAGPDPGYGHGLVDARDAVLAARGDEPDRGNVILAGGRETFAAAGRLAGARGPAVQTEPVVRVAGEDGYVEFQFPVKPGATRADVEFAWTGASSTFRVYLASEDATLGPWTATADGARRVARATVEGEDLTPGAWTLAARGVAAGEVTYSARATVTVAARAESSSVPPELLVPDAPAGDGFWSTLEHEALVAKVRAEVALRRAREWTQEHPALAFTAFAAVVGAIVATTGGPWLRRQLKS